MDVTCEQQQQLFTGTDVFADEHRVGWLSKELARQEGKQHRLFERLPERDKVL